MTNGLIGVANAVAGHSTKRAKLKRYPAFTLYSYTTASADAACTEIPPGQAASSNPARRRQPWHLRTVPNQDIA